MPTAATATSPIAETFAPSDQAELVDVVCRAVDDRTPLYPWGGQTALSFGTAPKLRGWGLSTERLTGIVDYPARDMTITVESGLTVAKLQATLAAEGQFLPVDVAESDRATIGGAVAVNFSGPRRFGYGTLRDYVIGISAVDGHGTPFKAGGRVVKNVAGYDFCKLLTGSLGTLAVITQLTLKVRPRPAASVFLSTDVETNAEADRLLERLVHSQTTPSAVEWLAGPQWNDLPGLPPIADSAAGRLLVGLEGTAREVEWMIQRLRQEWQEQGATATQLVEGSEFESLRTRITAFGCGTPPAGIVLKFNLLPSRVVGVAELVRSRFPAASVACRAGSGIVLALLPDTAVHELAKSLLRDFQPAAVAAGGRVSVWNSPSPEELTRQTAWGSTRDDDSVMQIVKRQFDPHNLLNPGRFIF